MWNCQINRGVLISHPHGVRGTSPDVSFDSINRENPDSDRFGSRWQRWGNNPRNLRNPLNPRFRQFYRGNNKRTYAVERSKSFPLLAGGLRGVWERTPRPRYARCPTNRDQEIGQLQPASAPANPDHLVRLCCHLSEKRFINSAYLAGQKAVWAHLLLRGKNRQTP